MKRILLGATAIAALTILPFPAYAQQCPPGQECPPAAGAPPAASPDVPQPPLRESAPPMAGDPRPDSASGKTELAPQTPSDEQQAPGQGDALAEKPKGDASSEEQRKSSSDTKSAPSSSQEQPSTSGTAGAESSSSTEVTVEISQEQRVEIRNVVQEVNVERVEVDFDISIGVAVPRTVVLHPLPQRIVEIVPAYRSYVFFILADGRIVIINPATLVIVTVITV